MIVKYLPTVCLCLILLVYIPTKKCTIIVTLIRGWGVVTLSEIEAKEGLVELCKQRYIDAGR